MSLRKSVFATELAAMHDSVILNSVQKALTESSGQYSIGPLVDVNSPRTGVDSAYFMHLRNRFLSLSDFRFLFSGFSGYFARQ